MSSAAAFAEGMRRLRRASVLNAISGALGIAALIFLRYLVYTYQFDIMLALNNPRKFLMDLLRHAAPGIAFANLSHLISIIATLCYLIPAAARLASWKSEYSSLSKMVKYGFLGSLALQAILLVSLVAWLNSVLDQQFVSLHELQVAFIGLGALAAIGFFLLFIGWAGFLVLLDRLRSAVNVEEFHSAIILFVVVAALLAVTLLFSVPSVASFLFDILSSTVYAAAWYQVWVGAGKALDAASNRLAADQQRKEESEEKSRQEVANPHAPQVEQVDADAQQENPSAHR